MAFAVTDVVLATRGDEPEPVPCPRCGEVLTGLMGGGFECEVNGCDLSEGQPHADGCDCLACDMAAMLAA